MVLDMTVWQGLVVMRGGLRWRGIVGDDGGRLVEFLFHAVEGLVEPLEMGLSGLVAPALGRGTAPRHRRRWSGV